MGETQHRREDPLLALLPILLETSSGHVRGRLWDPPCAEELSEYREQTYAWFGS